MRCFIAIEFDNETRAILSNIQRMFRDGAVRGNYTRDKNLHLTLKFLGEIDKSVYQNICKMLFKIAQKYSPFVLTLDRIGKFNKGNKKIIWAGLLNNNNLLNLYKDIEDELGTIMPIEKEKHYTPHITLIREATISGEEINSPEISKILKHSFLVLGVSLMESTRVDGKLTYVRKAYESFSK